ncbi:galactose-binding domain-like protein [Phakopsora pachyrhizi]|nr:galactose-binding domain-like protein [Phakopsora pachyrhizi]
MAKLPLEPPLARFLLASFENGYATCQYYQYLGSSAGKEEKFNDWDHHSIILPGRGPNNMGGGWETKRSQEPNHSDHAIINLANKGYLDYVKIDTNYFIENFPQRIELYATNSNKIVPGTSTQWTKILVGEKLGPHQQQYFQLLEPGIVHTHVKMVIIPDGGVKQIRVMGSRFPIKQRFEITKTRSTPQVKATTFTKISSQGVNPDSVTRLLILPLTRAAFTSYGCKPWDAEVLADGICQWTLKGLERHPFSSQTFTPLMVHKSGEGGIDDELYLFVVALDGNCFFFCKYVWDSYF